MLHSCRSGRWNKQVSTDVYSLFFHLQFVLRQFTMPIELYRCRPVLLMCPNTQFLESCELAGQAPVKAATSSADGGGTELNKKLNAERHQRNFQTCCASLETKVLSLRTLYIHPEPQSIQPATCAHTTRRCAETSSHGSSSQNFGPQGRKHDGLSEPDNWEGLPRKCEEMRGVV